MVRHAGRLGAPSLAAGLLLAASLPPWGWWPLAWCGAALLSWRLATLAPLERLAAGWLAGLGWFVPGLVWAAAFNWYGAVVLMVVEALFCAAAALVVVRGPGHVLSFCGAFTLAEAARSAWPFGGLPIAGPFLGQAGGPLLASARLGGPLLMDALVFAAGAGLGELVPAALSRARGARPAARPLAGVLALGVVAAVALAGALAPDGGRPTREVAVALVQGGGRRGVDAAEVPAASVLAAQMAASGALARPVGDPPALVVWPEDVIKVGRTLAGTRPAAFMARLARRLGATVLAGVTETVSASAFRNEAVAWGPTGRVLGAYEKVHRVPFGEYVPDRGFFAHLASLRAVPLDAVAGTGSGELATPAGRLGLMLSYEVFFATRGRAAVRAGAELLVVPTNTSSYATDQVPSMEVAADRVQAVAFGRDLVQAAPTGYSTVVGPQGAVLERSALGRRQVLRATVALRRGTTLYARAGDVPVLCLAALALAAGLAWRARRPRQVSPVVRQA